jgi:plastocyanin domain-containing protein
MKTKIIGMAVALVAAGAVWLATMKTDNSANTVATKAPLPVAAVPTGDKQVIEILVKDGYQPNDIDAKAGVPTVLKMKTQATFDCSTEFTIPQLGVRVHLEPTGETAIDIPAQKAGDSIYGVCGMGMDKLEIKFN